MELTLSSTYIYALPDLPPAVAQVVQSHGAKLVLMPVYNEEEDNYELCAAVVMPADATEAQMDAFNPIFLGSLHESKGSEWLGDTCCIVESDSDAVDLVNKWRDAILAKHPDLNVQAFDIVGVEDTLRYEEREYSPEQLRALTFRKRHGRWPGYQERSAHLVRHDMIRLGPMAP